MATRRKRTHPTVIFKKRRGNWEWEAQAHGGIIALSRPHSTLASAANDAAKFMGGPEFEVNAAIIRQRRRQQRRR